MRFLMLVKAGEDYEAGLPPSPELMARMGELSAEMTEAGILLSSEGLLPTSQGTRIALTRGKIAVTDGPFAETKEVIGGFAIVKAASKDEALDLASRFINVHKDSGISTCEVEVRPLMDAGQCPAAPA